MLLAEISMDCTNKINLVYFLILFKLTMCHTTFNKIKVDFNGIKFFCDINGSFDPH